MKAVISLKKLLISKPLQLDEAHEQGVVRWPQRRRAGEWQAGGQCVKMESTG